MGVDKNSDLWYHKMGDDVLELLFTILLFVLIMLVYFSNRDNSANKWCALTGFIFWLGVFKEAMIYNILPPLEEALQKYALQVAFMPLYSVFTWMLYSLAMPTSIIFALYFNSIKNSKLMRCLIPVIYVPALALSFFFPPLLFRGYQMSSLPFWISYSIYNLSFCVIFAVLMVRGVRIESPGKAKTQKKYVRAILLPPVLYWALSVFLTHPFRLERYFKLWQGNIFILAICVIMFVVTAFKDGMMGLRLTGESYSWNSDMNIVNKGAQYTSHMLKNQTFKMEWCIENLKAGYDTPPEELAILSRSIAAIKTYTDKAKKYSDAIRLLEEPCELRALIENGVLSNPNPVNISVPEDVYWVCDKTHMTEVFYNILKNAAEAAADASTIEVFEGEQAGGFYTLIFKDHGVGMSSEDVKNMFAPYFTTKNPEKNFGLGLSYCKNVLEKHGGHIKVKSETGAGTSVTILYPAKKTAVSGTRLTKGGRHG